MIRRLVVLMIALAALTVTAAAETDNRPFFWRLFGLGRQSDTGTSTRPSAGPQIIKVQPTTRQAARPAPEDRGGPRVISVGKKNADARQVLVIGDRLADDLGKGLGVAFADRPDVAIEVTSDWKAGLTDRTSTDWKAWLDQRFEKAPRPAAVVVMLGLGDAVPIDLGDHEVAYPSVEWETIYRARIDQLVGVVSDHHVPLYWVGLLPVADASQTNDLSYVDGLMRGEVTELGGTYVDVWDAFSESGAFTFSGPDIDGQVRQLRLRDGIGFTRSGARRLAFFAEQGLRSWLSRSAPAAALLDKVASDGYVMLLNDPQVSTEDRLLQRAELRPPKPGTALYRLVVEGRPLAPVPGRIDDRAAR